MYTAYVLSKSARSKILNAFPPKFSDVVAHHVTVKFGVSKDTPIPPKAKISVFGYICNDSVEALIVKINDKIQRSDGKLYHITLSLDRSKGAKPADSNNLIKNKEYTEVESFDIGETFPDLLD